MGVLDKLNGKLGKATNSIASIIEQPKHTAGGRPVDSGAAPMEDEELPEEKEAEIYTKPAAEIKTELGLNREEEMPLGITPDKKIDFSKQSNKMISITDKLQSVIFGLIADVEDLEEFKFEQWEKDEFMLFLPDIAEERGIVVSNELGLALAVLLSLLIRAKQAWRLRKAKKLEEERLAAATPKTNKLHVAE